MDEAKLSLIMNSVAKEYGFLFGDAVFAPFYDFKCRWVRNEFEIIHLQAPDYLYGAPEAATAGLLRSILDHAFGIKDRLQFEPATINYLVSDEFQKANKPVFQIRHGIRPDERLTRIFEGMQAEGILKQVEWIDVGSQPSCSEKGMSTSVVFATIGIDMKFLQNPENELRALIYAGCRCIEEGRYNFENNIPPVKSLEPYFKTYLEEYDDSVSQQFLASIKMNKEGF